MSLLVTSVMLISVCFASLEVDHRRVVDDCTTTLYTPASLSQGLTSTVYTATQTICQLQDCHGCSAIVVIPFGHIFKGQTLTPTATITAATPIRSTRIECSPTKPACGYETCEYVLSETVHGGLPKYNSTRSVEGATISVPVASLDMSSSLSTIPASTSSPAGDVTTATVSATLTVKAMKTISAPYTT